MDDRYGTDVLAAGWRQKHARQLPRVEAARDLVVEVAEDGFCGAVVGVASGMVELEDRARSPSTLPARARVPRRRRRCRARAPPAAVSATADRGARHPDPSPPRTRGRAPRAPAGSSSRAGTTPSSSRRCGATTCAPRASSSSTCRASTCSRPCSTPSRRRAERRYGVLVDHLVPGSKESRIADAIARGRHGAHVRIVGHPWIDVWQCVTPQAVGIPRMARRSPRHRVQGRRVPRARLARP